MGKDLALFRFRVEEVKRAGEITLVHNHSSSTIVLKSERGLLDLFQIGDEFDLHLNRVKGGSTDLPDATSKQSFTSPIMETASEPIALYYEAKFELFSDQTRKVLSLAQEESQRFNHNYIGTEHILLGLIRETNGMAARVLSNLSVDCEKMRSSVVFIIGRGDKLPQGELNLTPRSKKVIELAADEARLMSHAHIGTEHLLIGMIRENEGVAAGILESMGVTLDKVRQTAMLERLSRLNAHS